MRRALLVIAVLLAAAPAAHAGGFATATLSSSPKDVAAGEPWRVDVTIMQHGRTPMTDLEPAVIAVGPDGKETRFAARPTGRDGVYRAEVVFPAAGRWSYRVDDGFTNAIPHEFPPVEIRPAPAALTAPGGGDDGGPEWWALLPAGVVCAAAAVLLARRRAGRRGPRALPA